MAQLLNLLLSAILLAVGDPPVPTGDDVAEDALATLVNNGWVLTVECPGGVEAPETSLPTPGLSASV